MKKFLSAALFFFALFLVGCGGEKTPSQTTLEFEKVDAVLIAGSFWVIESENMPYLADALNRNDIEYLKQLIREEKVFYVDRDVKVTQLDMKKADGIAMIQFTEGRYTNKTGYTLAYNVFSVAEYPTGYLKAQSQAPLQLIKSALASTENYFDLIKAEDVDGLNQMLNFCDAVATTLAEKAEDMQIDSATRECIKAARKVIVSRGAAVLGGLKIIEYKQTSNEPQRKLAIETTYSLSKDAIQFREDFQNKYGF